MYRNINKNMQMSLEAEVFMQHKFSQQWCENIKKTADNTQCWRPLFSRIFKALTITFLPSALYCISIAMQKKWHENSLFCQALFSGDFTMSETWADTALFTLPFRALIARCFGTVKAPSPVVIITVARKRSAVSDWHSKWPFCQRGDSDMSIPGRHI